MRSYKSDLRFFHWTELSPPTGEINNRLNCKNLTSYIIYLLEMAFFKILESLLLSTLNYPTTVGNEQH